MKLIGVFILLCSSIKGFALYMGNPAEPEIIEKGMFIPQDAVISVKIGYQGDFIFDRRLRAYDGVQGRMDRFNVHSDQGVLTLSFFDRLDIYGSVGALETNFSHRPKPGHQRREYESGSQMTWGVGGRAILFKWGNTDVGMQGGFQWANPHIKWDALNGESFTTDAVLRYREWQIGVAASHQIDLFTPYLGVKYSHVFGLLSQLRSNLELPKRSFKLRNRDYFGLVLGVTLSPKRWIDLTCEVRMIDEQAITIDGNLKF